MSRLLSFLCILGCALKAAMGAVEDDSNTARRRTQSDEEIMYQSMCNTTTGSVGDGKEVGQGQPQFPTQSACMCGFLRDAQPAETQLQSVRGARTSCTNGLATTTNKAYPCKDVDLLSFVSVTELNSAFGSASDRLNDIWGWTDPFTCTEIALVGTASGTAFVDITDPVNPKYLGKLPTRSGSSPWRDIKTYKNHAYIVSEASNHGLQVFRLSQLVRNRAGSPKVWSESEHYDQFGGRAHNIFINEDTGYAYVVGTSRSGPCAGGLHIINLSDPYKNSPKYAGCFSNDGYTHDVQCVLYKGSDSRYKGSEICFACNEDTVTIIDVTDKNNMRQLSRTPYDGEQYTHQGWLTEDHNHFIFGDETDEQNLGVKTKTFVLNTANLENPSIASYWSGTTAAIDHNQYILGSLAYQANYRAGLRILEIKDATAADFKEKAFFDTYPGSDSANFNGAWSNYPYFPSGTVIVSSIEEGLFVLETPALPSPIPQCTAQPTISPAPTRAPVPPSGGNGDNSPTTTTNGGFQCFSGVNTVEVEGKGFVSMDALQVGDYVRSDKSKFSRVYSFGHLDRDAEAEYQQIHADDLTRPLEVTSKHMVFVNGKMRPASQVKVGDMLGQNKVSHVAKVRRRGIYAPFTDSGDLIVSGALTSSYVTSLDYSLVDQHLASHAVLAPLRLACFYDFALCKNETYTDGFSDLIVPLAKFAVRIQVMSAPVQIGISLAVLPFVFVVYLFEQLVLLPVLFGSLMIIGLVVYKKKRKTHLNSP